MKKHRRGKLCCCDKEAFVHKFTLLTLVVDVALVALTTILYIDLIFGKNIVNAFHFVYRDGVITDEQMD